MERVPSPPLGCELDAVFGFYVLHFMCGGRCVLQYANCQVYAQYAFYKVREYISLRNVRDKLSPFSSIYVYIYLRYIRLNVSHYVVINDMINLFQLN